MKNLIIPLIAFALVAIAEPQIEAPKLIKARLEGQNHVRLTWVHPDCYLFDVMQVSEHKAETNRVFFRSAQVHQLHEFNWRPKLTGTTNRFAVRAILNENDDKASDWGNVVTVVP